MDSTTLLKCPLAANSLGAWGHTSFLLSSLLAKSINKGQPPVARKLRETSVKSKPNVLNKEHALLCKKKLDSSSDRGASRARQTCRGCHGCSCKELTFLGEDRDIRYQQPTALFAKVPCGTEEKKQSKSQQLKKIFKEYGAVGVSVHIGISLVSLGMFYMVVSSGLDISAILLKLGFKESLVQSKMAAGTSTFVVAYAIHKLFAPVRISITLVSVPFIVRYFRKVGLFKPPAAKP